MSHYRKKGQSHFTIGKKRYNLIGVPRPALEFWRVDRYDGLPNFYLRRSEADAFLAKYPASKARVVSANKKEYQHYLQAVLPWSIKIDQIDSTFMRKFESKDFPAAAQAAQITQWITQWKAHEYAETTGGVIYDQIEEDTWVKETEENIGETNAQNFLVVTEAFPED